MAPSRGSSSRAERTRVKGGAAKKGGLSRHLKGWQPAALAIFIAGTTAALVHPWPVDPVDLPEPRVNPGALERTMRADEVLALGADRERLDVDVLELGSAIFAFDEAEARGDDIALVSERTKVLDAAQRALRASAPQVLALRAHHLRSFLAEIRRWERTGEETARLRQLGGAILRRLRQDGWIQGSGGALRLVVDRTTLAVTFKRRWNEITGLRGEPFDVTLDESRAFYRFVLLHPIPPPASAEQYRLKKLAELGAVDPGYPLHLARGVVLYQLQRYPEAAQAFLRHLEASPDGPLTLRAQNYLAAALRRAREE